MKKLIFFLILSLSAYGAGTSKDCLDDKPDPKVEVLLNNFINALLIADENGSAKECLKYTHKSLWNSAGTDLTQDLRRFSFKKAHDNAKFYQVPVKITRV